MLIYWSIIGLALMLDIACSARIGRSYELFALTLFFMYITVISAIRLNVGTDYGIYENYFSSIRDLGSENLTVERGFTFFIKTLISMGFTDRAFFVLSSILINGAVYYLIKKNIDSLYWGLAAFLYICGGFFFNSMNLVRQFMAIALGIFAFMAYCKKRVFTCLMFLLAAFLFHSSAFVLLLILGINILLNSKKKYSYILLLFILAVVVSFSGVSPFINRVAALNPHWAYYVGNKNTVFFTERNSSAVFKLIIPTLIVLLGVRKDYEMDKEAELKVRHNFLYSISLSGSLCYILLQIMGYGIQPVYRLGLYFFPFFIVYVCYVVGKLKGTRETVCKLAIILYFILLTYVTVFLWNGSGVMPYESIFSLEP